MANANEEYLDSIIRHQIFLLRTAGSTRNKIIALLNATEKELANVIRNSLTGIGPGLTPRNLRRVKQLLLQIKAIRSPAWDDIRFEWFKDFKEIVKNEPIFLQTAASTVLPIQISLSLPSVNELTSLVNNNAFEGRTLSQWASKIKRDDINRIDSQIKIGLVQGETGPQIARRVVGTARLRGTDGVTQITRRNAIDITRTAVIAYSNLAAREFILANKSLFKGEIYIATLDARTTPICRSLDGNIYPPGEGPIPPVHFNCRSIRAGFFDDAEGASRPFDANTEKLLVLEFTRKNNLPVVRKRVDIQRGFKDKFDKFARVQKKELIGQVPAKVNYSEWIKRQSVSFQNDVLGITKARLFRKGNLELDRFVSRRGDELTLKQMVLRDRQAFIDAGLDPDNFN